MAKATKEVRTPAPFRAKGLGELARTTMRFVRRHPDAARQAVADALEMAADERGNAIDGAQHTESLRDIAPIPAGGAAGTTLIGAAEAAERLQVSRRTIYDWVKNRTMVGWRSDDQKLAIPEEQILGPRKLVLGLEQLLTIIGEPRRTWAFITKERFFGHEWIRPIDKQKRRELEDVVAVALSCRENSMRQQTHTRKATKRSASNSQAATKKSRVQGTDAFAAKERSAKPGAQRARRA